jgi:hypothetical protein
MLGPVLYQELLLTGRRRRLHLLRWIYGGVLLAEFCYIFVLTAGLFLPFDRMPRLGLVEWSRTLVHLLLWQQLVLILLVTPAFVAGEVTDEKTRGTLQYLLTTDLKSWEIVLGKQLAQVAALAGLQAMNVPLLCFAGLTGEYPLEAVLAQQAALFLLTFLLGAASLLVSVWSRSTSDAMVTLYGAGALLLLTLWGLSALAGAGAPAPAPGGEEGAAAPGWLAVVLGKLREPFHPYYLLEAAWLEGTAPAVGARLVTVALTWGGLAGMCLALASWRLRPAYLQQLQSAGQKRERVHARRPPIGEAPVRWREQYVVGIAPLAVLRRVPVWAAMLLVATATVAAMLLFHPGDVEVGDRYVFHIKAGLVLMLATGFVVGVRASGCITREREQRTWEAVLLSHLRTRRVVRDKFWGILRAAAPYLVAYTGAATAVAGFQGLRFAVSEEAQGWRVGSVALTNLEGMTEVLQVLAWLLGAGFVAVWVAGSGVRISARTQSSWRSLVATLGMGYVPGMILGLFLPFGLGWLCMIPTMQTMSVFGPRGFGGGSFELFFGVLCVGMLVLLGIGALILLIFVARSDLTSAENAILETERTWAMPEGLFQGPFARRPRDLEPHPVSRRLREVERP